MCGRFVRCSTLEEIADYFDIEQPSFEFEPSYNVAPTHDIIIINNRGVKQLVKCHWGFVPPWAKDLSDGYKMINAPTAGYRVYHPKVMLLHHRAADCSVPVYNYLELLHVRLDKTGEIKYHQLWYFNHNKW